MAVNVEELILDANSDGLREAAEDYDKLGDAGEKTEGRVSRSSRGMEDSISTMGRNAAKSLAAVAAAYVSLNGAAAALNQARNFDAAFAETSTLIEGTTAELAALEEGSKSLADLYGTTAVAQVQAYYQAISAGASDVTVATEILDQANKLAIGGITDVSVGVDALTTAVNAYGPSVLSAGEASDAMFVAMRAGKTTIGELSASLGNIVPLAASAGIAFDEVVGGIAALTTQGLSTSVATTQLRQVIAGIVKPTQEAKDAAKELGIEFDVASLRSKGLAGFLEDIIEKTDGNTDEMAKLFGSVEALGAALAFAGGGGEAFTAIMEAMGMKLGATDVAVKKISESLSKQLSDDLQRLSNIGLEFGEVLLEIAVPALSATVDVLQLLGENADVLTPIILTTGGALVALQLSGTKAAAGLTAAALASVRYVAVAAVLTPQLGLMATAQIALTGATTALTAAVTLLTGPLGVIVAGVAAATIAINLMGNDLDEAAVSAEASAQALGDLDYALRTVNTSTEAGSARARQIAASHYQAAEAALTAAEAEARLALERFNASQETFNPFDGPSNAELREVHANLLVAQAAVQAIRDRMAEFGAITNESGEVIDENTGRVVRTAEEIQRMHAMQLKFMSEDRQRSAEQLAEANEILTKYQQQVEMQRLIGMHGSDSVQVAAERQRRERAVVEQQLEGLDVAQSVKDEILNAVDATYQTEQATAAWEQRMVGVAAQINAIGNALSQFGSSAINTAANNAEIAALEAGATVQEAAHQRTLEQINLETEARIAGTNNIVEQMAIRAAAAQEVAEVESQAALAAARAAANERDAANAGGSRATKSQKELNKLRQQGIAITKGLLTEQEQYNEAIAQADRLLAANAISAEFYRRHVEQLNEELDESKFDDITDKINHVSGSMIDAAFSAESYGDVLSDVARAGVDAMAELAAEMLKTYIQQKLLEALLGTPGGDGGLFQTFTGFFGGARADGGPVVAGTPYLVNENTPNSEIFVPSQSGAILNVSQAQEAMRSQQSPTIQVAPAPVNLYDDPRTIDRHRMSPDGERARQRANRRLENV